MGCCSPYQFPFSNAAFTNIPYTDAMKAALGQYPQIAVFYYDQATNDYYEVNGIPGTQVKFNGSMISVDHGGANTGIVKVS